MVVMKEGPTTYFVQRLANKETLKIICSEIIKSPSLPLVKPEVGVLCASMFEGEWYRARVLMLDPQLAVQYVDYGNVDICDPTKLHELPQSIAGFPPMAEKVEFDDKTPAEVCAELFDGAIISIKLTGKTENGALKVTKDNGNNAVLAIQNSSASLSQDDSAKDAQHISTSSLQAEETPTFPNVSPAANVSAFSTSDAETIELVDSAVETDRLSVAIKAVVIMKEGPKTYFIQQLANNDKLKLICEEVVKSPSLPLVKPEVGMLCAAMFEGEWYRARVLLLDPQLAVQYIDYGNIDICDPARLHELPQSIVDFPPMAEKIEFVDETQELSDGCIISVMPTGETENGVMKVRFDDGKKAFFTHVASSVPPQSDSTAKESQQASAASVQVSTSQAETSKSVVTPSCADNLSPVATLLQVVCASSASVEIPNEEKAFAKAKITVLNDSMDYWVTWEHNLETVDKIILKTNENITSAPLENPEVGLLCAAKFDGIWFRAHIVKISPEVQVHYLDYGNYEICTNNDLRDLPEALKDLPPMAFRVQLAEGTPQEYHSLLPEEFLSIRVVEQREAGVSVVQVEGVKYAGGVTADMLPAATNTVPSSVPSSSQENVTSIPSTTNAQVEKSTIPKSPHCEPSANSSANVPVNMINAPKFYDVRVAVTVGDKDYWVQRVNRDKELQFVMVQVNDYASKCIRMTPEVGKLCATEFLGLWYRARITKVAPEVEVHFIDFGNTEIRKKDEILEMPESVQEVSPLALRIRLADGTPAKFSNLQVDSIISVKPFMKTSDSVIVLVEGVEYAMDSEETTSQDVTSTVCASLEKQPEPGSSKTEQVFTLK